MKKHLSFAIFGTRYDIFLKFVLILATFFVAGIALSSFFSFEISDKLFSPFIIFSGEKGTALFPLFFHSFLYFFLFIIIAVIFATSCFGFALFPVFIFIKGLLTALTVRSLFTAARFTDCFFLYAPLLTLETAVLLIYFSQCILTSLSFLRGEAARQESEDNVFVYCLKQFVIIAVFMTILASLSGLMQYFV